MLQLQSIGNWLAGPNGAILFAVLWGASETLAQIPSVKANSVFQAVVQVLTWIKGKLVKS